MATGPACPVGDAVGINGIAAWLGGCVIGTEHGRSCESAELGQDKIWGVPAQLVGVLLTRVVHAVAAAVVVITDEPAISLEFKVTFASIACWIHWRCNIGYTCDGGGNCNTGTAGICTGDLVDGLFSFAASVDTHCDVLGTWGNSNIVDVGLPIPVIECLIALHLLGLELLADLVLSKLSLGAFWQVLHFPF